MSNAIWTHLAEPFPQEAVSWRAQTVSKDGDIFTKLAAELPRSLEGLELSDPTPQEAARFYDKVMPEPMSGCFLWLGSVSSGGYGNFWLDGKCRKAHRVSYAIANGGLEPGIDVMHKCDNTFCVNPNHLEAVPTAANIRDAFNKGRLHRRGDKNSHTKIPDGLIEVVKRLASAGVETSQLAYGFMVDQSTIRRIVRDERQSA